MIYHSGVCESNNKTVFRSCISILGLSDKSLSSIVIGFSFPTDTHRSVFVLRRMVPFLLEGEGVEDFVPTTTIFRLIAREVGLAFDIFDERLEINQNPSRVGIPFFNGVVAATKLDFDF